jgi:hypothetical protein
MSDIDKYLQEHQDRALKFLGADSTQYKRYSHMRNIASDDKYIGVWLDGDNTKVMHIGSNFHIDYPAKDWTPAHITDTEQECQELMQDLAQRYKNITLGGYIEQEDMKTDHSEAFSDNRDFAIEQEWSIA